jgi:hypothetical protein
MHSPWRALFVAVLIPAWSMPVYADCQAHSPNHSTALIELYTSEGCDSCPPADRWFSSLSKQQLGDRAVALALHVDYWDRLGWRDRFGSAGFSQRQREESARSGGEFVYTPQVLLQGRDFAQWQTGAAFEQAIAAVNARPARAVLDLAAHPGEGNKVDVDLSAQVTDPRERADAVVALALVQSGLASDVKAGENAGKRLQHDHVVRQWRPIALNSSGAGSAKLSLVLPADSGPLSVVVLAENARTGDVLQVVELPLCAAR